MRQRNNTTNKGPVVTGYIFVVDDNLFLRDFSAMMLQAEGYEVASFSQPEEVLQALEKANPKPALLVSDYEMGGMNGMELICRAHRIHPALKTILVSGTVDNTILSGHPGQVDQFLAKPYERDQLKGAVADLMRR